MPAASSKPDAKSRAYVIREAVQSYSCVLLWMSVSISVILFNKWLLAYSGFPYPISLTLWHMTFCTCMGTLTMKVLRIPTYNMTRRDYFRRVMPIGLLYAGSLWLSNSAYLYLSVSFIQMTKSLMPGLVYLSGVHLGTEKFSKGTTLNMLLIAFGVLVCAMGEANLVIKGLVQQLTALQFEAARLTMVQLLMDRQGQKLNPIQSLYYISPACLVSLLVPFAFVELPQLMTSSSWKFNPSIMLANALTAFFLNLVVFLLIGKTSALTMNIAGVIKDWMLIFFSFYVFKAPLTQLNLAGYAFCCSGVFVYQYMKYVDIRREADRKAAAQGQGGHDVEKLASGGKDLRSKETLETEIRNLQDQLAQLDKRVQGSDKVFSNVNSVQDGATMAATHPMSNAVGGGLAQGNLGVRAGAQPGLGVPQPLPPVGGPGATQKVE